MDKYRILVKGIVQYNDRYLIVERWYDDRIMNPYQWGFIDGAVEFGESPDKAVVRLVHENTGLTVEISKILYTWSFMIGEECNIGISYLCLGSIDEIYLSEDLHSYKWITKEEFDDYIENKAIIEDINRAEL